MMSSCIYFPYLSNISDLSPNFVYVDLCFVLDQHTVLDWCSASSLKQQSTCRHVILLTHIILNLGQVQPVYDLSPQCCMLSRDTANINSIVFVLTQWGIEHKIYHTRGDYPGLSTIGKYFNVQDKCILLWTRVNLYCKEWIVVIQHFPSYKTTPIKGHPSYSAVPLLQDHSHRRPPFFSGQISNALT